MTNPTADFDGCARECRKAGAHTLRWGGCEHATPPEPTVSMSKVFRDTDGCNSIGFDTYTVPQLAEVIEPALRSINIRIGPNALAMLERGEEVRLSVGEYASMALAAADAVVHRNDAALAAAGVAPAADQTVEEVAKHVTRAIFALKTPSPDGLQHYQSGWDDGLEAAMDAAREALLAVLPDQQAAIERAFAERLAAELKGCCPECDACIEIAQHLAGNATTPVAEQPAAGEEQA